MSVREQVIKRLESLSDDDLMLVSEYLAFLKFRIHTHNKPIIEQEKLAALNAEFADEDKQMAEHGMDEYAADLIQHGL